MYENHTEEMRNALKKIMDPYYDKIDHALIEYRKKYDYVRNTLLTEEIRKKLFEYTKDHLKLVSIPIYLEDKSGIEVIRLTFDLGGDMYANGRILYVPDHVKRNMNLSLTDINADIVTELDSSGLASVADYTSELLRKTKILHEIYHSMDECREKIFSVFKGACYSFNEEKCSSFVAIRNRCKSVEEILTKIKSSDQEGN